MSELSHHGVKGQKWGVRRYQNKDGSLTKAGRQRITLKDKYKMFMLNANRTETEYMAMRRKHTKNKKFGIDPLTGDLMIGPDLVHTEKRIEKGKQRVKEYLDYFDQKGITLKEVESYKHWNDGRHRFTWLGEKYAFDVKKEE